MNERESERDSLVKRFAYEFVHFNHNLRQAYLVTDVTDDCMLELEGMSGQFAPSLFQLAKDVPHKPQATTNIPESQPVDEGGAAERIKVVIRAATSDDWIGVAYQKDYTGDPSTIHEYIRAPSPDSIREKAERAARVLIYDDDYLSLSPKANRELLSKVVRHVADIIGAEFGVGENKLPKV